jgi:hypothetical protein
MKQLIFFVLLMAGIAFPQYNWHAITIDSAGTLTPAIELQAPIHFIQVVVDTPWTDADLTFQIYDEQGAAWVDVVDTAGVELRINVDSTKVQAYGLEPKFMLLLAPKFRIRSGTSATPVEQDSTRTLRYKRGKVE